MTLSTNPKPTIYRNLYEDTGLTIAGGTTEANAMVKISKDWGAYYKES